MQQYILSALKQNNTVIAEDGNTVYHIKDNLYVYPTEIGIYDGFILYEMDAYDRCFTKTNGKTSIITDYAAHKSDIDDWRCLVCEDEMDFFNFINILTIFHL